MFDHTSKSEPRARERVTPSDLGYESRLSPARVTELFIEGSLLALEPPLVAIVGTRHPDGDGLAMARALAEALADRGVSVLSGGALGIDAAAHCATIDREGRTVIVLPSGLDRPYPLRHRAMYARACALGGAIVSMFRDDTPPTRWTFPRRNELLAALCDVMVLVQAPTTSGALLAATFARKIGRRLLVVPAAPGDRRGAGCLAMLRAGAALCSGPDDVFAALEDRDGPLMQHVSGRQRGLQRGKNTGAPRRRAHAEERRDDGIAVDKVASSASLPPLDLAQSRCVATLDEGPMHPDAISLRTGLAPASTRAALVTLSLLGLVVERSDGTYARART
jgi:DNA processing protein